MSQKRKASSRKTARKAPAKPPSKAPAPARPKRGAKRGAKSVAAPAKSKEAKRPRPAAKHGPSKTALPALPDYLTSPEPPEPTMARGAETPIWLVTILALIIYWGGLYVDSFGGSFNALVATRGDMIADLEARVPHSEADALVARGRQVYATYCVACHQPNGRGLPNQFPPVAGSDWVNTPGPNRLVRIVLNGLQGPITVSGQPFNNVMLAWRSQLKDEDIAAVLTYIRGNQDWGNTAGAVTPAQVAAIREATKAKAGYWSPDELLALPDSD